ncbi:MAG: ATP-dependent helicase [Candidatus Aminicenantes bacterium]|nr:ATP-dependent helicase [Candidatus Aminicenantes bacterium]
MQPEKVQITNKDISYAEKILLKQGEPFDQERKDFIRNLDTIDLQAVPGSGKTTALLAKLLILEKYLPFDDGSGILVISHTNAAIDEIKKKIGRKCSRIFSYPNFTGTIQSFVDRFLAIPYYANRYKKKPYRIDNEIYEEKVEKFPNTFIEGFSKQEQNNAKHFLRSNDLYKKYRLNLDENGNYILTNNIGKMLDFKKPRGNTKPQNYLDFSEDEKEKVKKWLFEFKRQILIEGVLCFDDAYFLANVYLKKFPKIKRLLQKRFRYVFVDEMQDMDTHQYKILEDIFYNDGDSLSNYQRIGDKNQAIFSGDVKIDDIWGKRKIELPLIGSYRLSPNIANVVKYFGLEFLEIEGRNNKANIKPHLIVFEKPKDVIKEFTKIIKKNNLDQIPTDDEYPFRAVGWTGKKNDKGLTIKNYHEGFDRDKGKTKTDYPNLKSYLLFYDEEKKILEPIRNNIFNAFLRILRFENKKDENDRNYTKRIFLNSLKEKFPGKHEKFPGKYEEFKLKLFNWSFGVIKGNVEDAFFEIKNYIPSFLKEVFEINGLNRETKDFISNINQGAVIENSEKSSEEQDNKRNNIYQNKENGIKVKVGTVHSVKGKTHMATLYMETYYDKNYEFPRLTKSFFGEKHNLVIGKKNMKGHEIDVRKKQSTKMVYVGFSRPTHLLCFAVHKDRFKRDKMSSIWEICEII